jgi:hypothetical protein
MFLSYLAYLFLSLIYNEARNIDESISLENVLDHLLSVNIIYMTDGKKEKKIINSKSPLTIDFHIRLVVLSSISLRFPKP